MTSPRRMAKIISLCLWRSEGLAVAADVLHCDETQVSKARPGLSAACNASRGFTSRLAVVGADFISTAFRAQD